VPAGEGSASATRPATRKPGTSTVFVDSATGEDIFEVALDPEGVVFVAFRLYDADGNLVAETKGLERFPEGLTVRCPAGEVLLEVPACPEEPICYRLYNRNGSLLTTSDGGRTKIYSLLRMSGRDQRSLGTNGARSA
jgi:hypothetical protein